MAAVAIVAALCLFSQTISAAAAPAHPRSERLRLESSPAGWEAPISRFDDATLGRETAQLAGGVELRASFASVAPTDLIAALVGEYRRMPARQRLAVVAALTTSFVVMIGVGLLCLERVNGASPSAAPRRRTEPTRPPAGQRPARVVIEELGAAIRRQASDAQAARQATSPAAAEPERTDRDSSGEGDGVDLEGVSPQRVVEARATPARAVAASAGACSIDAYFAEIETLRPETPRSMDAGVLQTAAATQASRPAKPPHLREVSGGDCASLVKAPTPQAARIEAEEALPTTVGPSVQNPRLGVTSYPSSRRKAWTKRLSEAADPAQREGRASSSGPASSSEDDEDRENRVRESKLFVVREIGRKESEARRLRENATGAAKPPAR